LIACTACSSRSVEIRDLGFLAPGRAQWNAVLRRESSGIDLVYANPAGAHRREWTDGKLGPARNLVPAPNGPLFDGRLELSDLARAATGSSAELANGWLVDGKKPIGWCPSVSRAADGSLHLAYDAFRSGDYDVVYRAPNGDETIVAGTRRFEAHPSLAIDRSNRIWLAWDSAGEWWGSEGALHTERVLHLAVLAGGEWHDAPLAWPDDLAARSAAARAQPNSETQTELEAPRAGAQDPEASTRSGAQDPEATTRVGAQYDGERDEEPVGPRDTAPTSERAPVVELPRLVAEESGAIWIFYRVMIPRAGERHTGSNRHVAWVERALALVDGGWLGPWTLPESDGGNADSLAAIALPGEGVLAVYGSDRRLAQFDSPGAWYQPIGRESELHAVRLHAPGGPPKIGAPRRTGRIDPPSPKIAEDPDPALAPRGFSRVWGDLHRHTDLSRCKMDLDGTAIDQFRYAIDVAHLDFVAITDHFQHMTRDGWRYSREATARFFVPDAFLTLYGFEMAFKHGHRNLFCIDPAQAEPAPFRGLAEDRWRSTLKAPDWIAIPHQLADPVSPLSWTEADSSAEPLVEIYQQRRGAYETPSAKRATFQWDRGEPGVIDYLEDGRRFGVVACSDHISSGHAFTAAYVHDRSRTSLFEALHARRTYAATAKIALDVELGGLVMGEAGHVDAAAPLVVRADAGREIAAVEVIRDGEIAKRWHGQGAQSGVVTLRMLNPSGRREVTLDFEDATIAHASPQSLEHDDSIAQSEHRVVLTSSSDANMDEDGVAVPLAFKESSAVLVRSGSDSKRFVIASLGPATAPSQPFELEHVAMDIRFDDPSLGESKLEREWKPGDWQHGDWVYVRVSCSDGEIAWSSPIWVE
jgi:hypothetical protein